MKKNICICAVVLLIMAVEAIFIVKERVIINNWLEQRAERNYKESRNRDIEKIASLASLPVDSDSWYNKYHIIAHSGGAIGGIKYTNSLEAVKYSYEKGIRLFDIDFNLTIDSALVCRHDWADDIGTFDIPLYSIVREDQKELLQIHSYLPVERQKPMSLSAFEKTKIDKRFTSMTADDFISFMIEHEDVVLIADFKKNVPLLYATFVKKIKQHNADSLLNRVFVGFSNRDDINKIVAVNKDVNLVYRRYSMGKESYYDVAEFCIKNDIHVVNIAARCADDKGIKLLSDKGICVYIGVIDNLIHYDRSLVSTKNGRV